MDKVNLYVKQEDYLDTIERYSGQDYIEVRPLTIEQLIRYRNTPIIRRGFYPTICSTSHDIAV